MQIIYDEFGKILNIHSRALAMSGSMDVPKRALKTCFTVSLSCRIRNCAAGDVKRAGSDNMRWQRAARTMMWWCKRSVLDIMRRPLEHRLPPLLLYWETKRPHHSPKWVRVSFYSMDYHSGNFNAQDLCVTEELRGCETFFKFLQMM